MTPAGLRLLGILPGPDDRGNGIDWRGRIERIEAEAVAGCRAELLAECANCGQPKVVHGTDGRPLPDACEWDMQTMYYRAKR